MPAYDSILEFSRKILKNANVNTYVVDEASLAGLDLDLGLRKKLMSKFDFENTVHRFLETCENHVLYFSQDCFYCRSTIMKLPDTSPQLYFYAGPYMFREVDAGFFLKIKHELTLPDEFQKFLKQYYTCIPFVEYEDQLRSIFLLLASEIYGGPDHFTINYNNFYSDEIGDSYYSQSPVTPDNRELIEERYAIEKELMQAVATGNLEKIELFISGENPFQLEQRFANRIRNEKNYLIVLNTLLRKAAEYGGVHPLYLDDISSRYAREIELITSETESQKMRKEMMRKYCLMVKSHSLKGYSPIIQKVINHIHMSLSEDLSLKTLSETFTISPTYLSALFRKETGQTLTEYVNKKRIEHSVFLLNSTSLNIQTIASACGITDINYFTRLFKKYMGNTPSKYREFILRK